MKGHGAQKLETQQETASLGTKGEVTPAKGSSLMRTTEKTGKRVKCKDICQQEATQGPGFQQ